MSLLTLPTFEHCIVDFEFKPRSWADGFILLFTAVSIMTAWRLFFSHYFRYLSNNFVFQNTGVDVRKFGKPSFYTQDIETWKIGSLNEFCKTIFEKTNESDLISHKFMDPDSYDDNIQSLSSQLSLTLDDIESYIHYYKMKIKMNNLSDKYDEQLWKAITMSIVTSFGVYALYDKIWVYDAHWLFVSYPQTFPFELRWYYYLGCGYHGHRLIFQFFDFKRKDFIATMIHHWITISLILGSYILGFTDVGAFVMLIHDNTDAAISITKIIKYNQLNKLFETICFGIFAVLWVLVRVVLFFAKIIYPLLFWSSPQYSGCDQYYYYYWAFVCGLSGLWILHNYWCYFLFKAIYRMFKTGAAQDTRSGSDEADSVVDDEKRY